MTNLPGVEYRSDKGNPVIDSMYSQYEIPFYKDIDYFSSIDNFVSFIKSVERHVRRSEEYKAYKAYLMEDIGLDHCQVLSNVTSNDNVTVEMHHGPIFTLFDIVAIVVDAMIDKGKSITSFSVAKIVLDEHYNNNVQVVMLSESVHQMVHDDDVFLGLEHAFGDLNAFIQKYSAGLDISHIRKLNRYIERSHKEGTFDSGVLDLASSVYKWSKEEGYDMYELYDDME